MIKSALALVGAIATSCVHAEAAVFTFDPTSISSAPIGFGSIDAVSFTLSVTDSIVRSGSFAYGYHLGVIEIGNPPISTLTAVVSGDLQALQLFQTDLGRISFAGGDGPHGTSSDYFSVNLQFTSAGQVSSGQLNYGDDSFQITLSGAGGVFQGDFARGNGPGVSVVGAIAGGFSDPTSLPEPATIELLVAGLVFFGVRRRSAR